MKLKNYDRKTNVKAKNLVLLFWIFLKAGTFTFAGGLAMLPIIKRDVIDNFDMMSEEELLEYFALAQTLPGVIAINAAVFVGKRTGGIPGAIAAGFGAAFPAFVAMLAAIVLLKNIPQTGYVQGAFKGISAASAALILSTAYKMGRKEIKKKFSVVVMLLTFICIALLSFNIFPVVICAGLAAVAYFYVIEGNVRRRSN